MGGAPGRVAFSDGRCIQWVSSEPDIKLRESFFQKGVWAYRNRVGYSDVPVIQTTVDSDILVHHVKLYADQDIVCLYGHSFEGLRVQDTSTRKTLESIRNVRRIFEEVMSLAGVDTSKGARLLSELSDIGELERRLRKEIGAYRR